MERKRFVDMEREEKPAEVKNSKYPPFRFGYIGWALVIAFLMGFDTGAHVVFVKAFGYPMGREIPSLIQLHGHLQLMGWAGLFIMGISLHVLPRLASVPLEKKSWIFLPLWLVVAGLLLRTVGHSVHPYVEGAGAFYWITGGFLLFAGLLELAGILVYLTLIISTARKGRGNLRPAFGQIFPFMATTLVGWLTYGMAQMVLLVQMVFQKEIALNGIWNTFSIQIFLFCILLPVCFAFSLRMLPLYLRLRSSEWWYPPLAFLYLALVVVEIPGWLWWGGEWGFYLLRGGEIGRGLFILYFIFQIDVLTRFRSPWTEKQKDLPAKEDRKPTRKNMPDYGEFGAFEWLIYTAYFYLALGALFEMINSSFVLMGKTELFSLDVVRHIYLLGFITPLIMGMSVRMVPGLLGKRRVAYPSLVIVAFFLINLTLLGRILLYVLPYSLLEFQEVQLAFKGAYGWSGVLGMAVVFILAFNLIATYRKKDL